MRSAIGFAIIVVLLLGSAWIAIHRGDDPGDPAPTALHVVDPRGDIEWSPPPSTTTTTSTSTTVALAEKPAARARTAPTSSTTTQAAAVSDGAWSCGGDLPPCRVLRRENPNRDLTVYNGGSHHPVGYMGGNPEGDSTASGKWQVIRSTWARFGGYVNAADAPWQVQDDFVRALWRGGRGCSHWKACA